MLGHLAAPDMRLHTLLLFVGGGLVEGGAGRTAFGANGADAGQQQPTCSSEEGEEMQDAGGYDYHPGVARAREPMVGGRVCWTAGIGWCCQGAVLWPGSLAG